MTIIKDPDDAPSEILNFTEVFSDINTPEYWIAESEDDLTNRLIILDGHSSILVYNQDDEDLKWEAYNEIGNYSYHPNKIGNGVISIPHTFYFEFKIQLSEQILEVSVNFDGTGVKAIVMPLKEVSIENFFDSFEKRLSSIFTSVMKPNDDQIEVKVGEVLDLPEKVQSKLSLKLALMGINVQKIKVIDTVTVEQVEGEIVEEVFDIPPDMEEEEVEEPTKRKKRRRKPRPAPESKPSPAPKAKPSPAPKPKPSSKGGPPPSPTPKSEETPSIEPPDQPSSTPSAPPSPGAGGSIPPSPSSSPGIEKSTAPPAPGTPQTKESKEKERTSKSPAPPPPSGPPSPTGDSASPTRTAQREKKKMRSKSEDVDDDITKEEEPSLYAKGMEEIEKSEVGLRHTHATWFERMIPNRAYSLVVKISTEEMRVKKSVTSMRTGEKKSETSSEMLIETDKKLTIEPEFPGCLVVPEQHVVDAGEENIRVKFHVTPIAIGSLDAKVKFLQSNKTVHTMNLETKVITHRLAKWSAILGAIGGTFPALLAFLFDQTPKQFLEDRSNFVDLTFLTSAGYFIPLFLMGIFFALSGGIYWLQKPSQTNKSVPFPR